MAHSQKSIFDHARNRSHPNINNEVICQQLEDLVKTRQTVVKDKLQQIRRKTVLRSPLRLT